MRVLTFVFSAAGTQNIVLTKPTTLLGVSTNSGTAVLSGNPSLVTTDLTAAAANALRSDIYAVLTNTNQRPQIALPIGAGTLYVTVSAISTVTVILSA